MQEIKFRGKRIDNGEWVYGDLLTKRNMLSNETAIIYFDGYIIPRSPTVNKKTVGQYIQTVNDIDIYVGDIVKAYKYGDKSTEPVINEITYRNGTYMFSNWTWIEFLKVFRYVEVVGNIHDNPELVRHIND